MSQFAGKVALITGGNAAIGRATAIAFATQGATVVVRARREQEGLDVIAEINALGGKAIFVKTDVSQEHEVKVMVEQTLARFGRLDCAFNNAGIEQELTPLPDQTEETYHRIPDPAYLRRIALAEGLCEACQDGRGDPHHRACRAGRCGRSGRGGQAHCKPYGALDGGSDAVARRPGACPARSNRTGAARGLRRRRYGSARSRRQAIPRRGAGRHATGALCR